MTRRKWPLLAEKLVSPPHSHHLQVSVMLFWAWLLLRNFSLPSSDFYQPRIHAQPRSDLLPTLIRTFLSAQLSLSCVIALLPTQPSQVCWLTLMCIFYLLRRDFRCTLILQSLSAPLSHLNYVLSADMFTSTPLPIALCLTSPVSRGVNMPTGTSHLFIFLIVFIIIIVVVISEDEESVETLPTTIFPDRRRVMLPFRTVLQIVTDSVRHLPVEEVCHELSMCFDWSEQDDDCFHFNNCMEEKHSCVSLVSPRMSLDSMTTPIARVNVRD